MMTDATIKLGNGVVNPDLTIKGADGLRIVDASVWVRHGPPAMLLMQLPDVETCVTAISSEHTPPGCSVSSG